MSSFLKNKFVIIIILAILAGGITWLYLSKAKKPAVPNISTLVSQSGTGGNAEKVGEIVQKLSDFIKD